MDGASQIPPAGCCHQSALDPLPFLQPLQKTITQHPSPQLSTVHAQSTPITSHPRAPLIPILLSSRLLSLYLKPCSNHGLSISTPCTPKRKAAKLRLMVKRILRKYKYPPDKQDEAIQLVLQQTEQLCAGWM